MRISTRFILMFMARTRAWTRLYEANDGILGAGAYVRLLRDFTAGETLARTRLNVQLLSSADNDGMGFYPNPAWGWNIVIALYWAQGVGGVPAAPTGYFSVLSNNWIWVQNVAWQADVFVPVNGAFPERQYSLNTAESRSIDCKAQRLTAAGNGAGLWLVIDAIENNAPQGTGLTIYNYSMGSEVLTIEP